MNTCCINISKDINVVWIGPYGDIKFNMPVMCAAVDFSTTSYTVSEWGENKANAGFIVLGK